MKALVFLALVFTSSIALPNPRETTIKIMPSDFIATYLNSMFAKNPFLDRKLGWGLMFLQDKESEKLPKIKASAGYFEESEIKEIEKAIKTAEIQFDDLVSRYKLKGKIEFGSEITKVKLMK